uniref:Putative LOC100890456 [Strongylocentrotus purpuratus] n=1 Tax=Lepeophtheirus salmonis TaxID=72036 RepID=A0A0K2UI99_LEPSM
MNSDIEEMIRTCRKCIERLPSLPKETMIRDPIPMRSFESTSADLFEYGENHYLVYGDRLSGYPYVEEFKRVPSLGEVIVTLRKIFSEHGIPVKIRTD